LREPLEGLAVWLQEVFTVGEGKASYARLGIEQQRLDRPDLVTQDEDAAGNRLLFSYLLLEQVQNEGREQERGERQGNDNQPLGAQMKVRPPRRSFRHQPSSTYFDPIRRSFNHSGFDWQGSWGYLQVARRIAGANPVRMVCLISPIRPVG
jgi:hypothetical protein